MPVSKSCFTLVIIIWANLFTLTRNLKNRFRGCILCTFPESSVSSWVRMRWSSYIANSNSASKSLQSLLLSILLCSVCRSSEEHNVTFCDLTDRVVQRVSSLQIEKSPVPRRSSYSPTSNIQVGLIEMNAFLGEHDRTFIHIQWLSC